jgi:hypothetical protein
MTGPALLDPPDDARGVTFAAPGDAVAMLPAEIATLAVFALACLACVLVLHRLRRRH